jgi:hypothetical protein
VLFGKDASARVRRVNDPDEFSSVMCLVLEFHYAYLTFKRKILFVFKSK